MIDRLERNQRLPEDEEIRITKDVLSGRGYSEEEVEGILAGPGTCGDCDNGSEGELDGREGGLNAQEGVQTKNIVKIVKGSAKPLLVPRIVGKGEIRVVEGSARPFLVSYTFFGAFIP